MGVRWVVWGLNKSTKNTTFFNLFHFGILGYLFIIQTKKLFFRLLFCTLVHMVYIASAALHRSKRRGLAKRHSRRRVCIMCGGKCRILHRNKKYKKNGKIQLVSQWVFSMSFKITKVKLLFIGWFFVLFVHLLRKWRILNFPRSSGGKHDKKDFKKSHFPFTLLLAILGGYGGQWWAKRLGFHGLWH